MKTDAVDPDPKKVEAMMIEKAQSFSDVIDRAAFNFLLAEGQWTEFKFAGDAQGPKPADGDEFPDWKMSWYSTLDPLFPLLLKRRAEKFDLKPESQADERTVHAFGTLRQTAN